MQEAEPIASGHRVCHPAAPPARRLPSCCATRPSSAILSLSKDASRSRLRRSGGVRSAILSLSKDAERGGQSRSPLRRSLTHTTSPDYIGISATPLPLGQGPPQAGWMTSSSFPAGSVAGVRSNVRGCGCTGEGSGNRPDRGGVAMTPLPTSLRSPWRGCGASQRCAGEAIGGF